MDKNFCNFFNYNYISFHYLKKSKKTTEKITLNLFSIKIT